MSPCYVCHHPLPITIPEHISTLPRQHHTAQQAVCTLYVVCICNLPHANFLASCAGMQHHIASYDLAISLHTIITYKTSPVKACHALSVHKSYHAHVFLSSLLGFDANRNLMSLECAGRQLMASQVMQTCAFSSWMLHILLCPVHSSLWRVQVKLILAMMAWHSTGVGK